MSPSKARLPAKLRKDLAVGLATIIDAVDFPEFVAALIEGTFQAIVDSSIQQMKAYSELIKDVASSVEAFAKDNVSADSARDRLIKKYAPLLGAAWPPKRKRASAKKKRARRLAPARQQLLATMVLMGINRIVVTDGKIGRPTQESKTARRASPSRPRTAVSPSA
jgi:hypothetical protein